jgi:type II secretory ATPase GspE/PulE/Tfp pilus assembly ATPase PilB-like protein
MIVCGPTGSGKTTTLYSLLKHVDSPEKNIITVEDPVEYQLEGINQVTVKTDVGLTFGAALRAILRQDPNIIMIGEIRDFETVDIAIKSALTGHLVLSTIHTTTACGSIVRLINMGVEPFLIDSAVVCILAQRLVRKICNNCKEEYPVSQDILDTLRVRVDKQSKYKFFRGKGCSRCFNLGYSGRISIAELLILTPKIRELILARSQEHVIKLQARREGMKSLREDGVRAALMGLTTLEEVVRITAPDD